jgi:hypothetical protein
LFTKDQRERQQERLPMGVLVKKILAEQRLTAGEYER